MYTRVQLRRMAVCVLMGLGFAAAARAQYVPPYLGGPYLGSYPGAYWYHQGYGGYYPNVPYVTPRPPTGTYLPGGPLRPWTYIRPRGGLVPQPYPYDYQPPLYAPRWYARPYYGATPAPPYYYPPPPFVRPRSVWPDRGYGAAERPWRNIPWADDENPPDGHAIPPAEGPTVVNPGAG